MKIYGKLKTVALSATMVGMMAATPMVTNAAGLGNETLQQGQHGQDVKPLQHQLKAFNYYHDKIDGIFGPHTFKAVNAFQQDYGLTPDGIAGPDTIDALKKVKSYQHTYQDAPSLEKGNHGKVVKVLQTQLKELQYYKGDLDGIFGPITEKAVKDFQKANDLSVDGIVGPNTYKALIHNPVPADTTKVESAHTGPSAKTETDASNSDQSNVSRSADHQNVETLYVKSTAYTADCSGCSGVTATGINLKKNPDSKVIAVDPSVIPLGSKVWVEGYGYAIAGDTGGAINGKRIDVFFSDRSKALNWGVKTVKVKVFK